MATSAFDDKSKKPNDKQVGDVLGKAIVHWKELKQLVQQRIDPVDEEWVFSGKAYGWSLRLKNKKRAILYMTPCQGYFRVAFAFGEKAVEAAHKSKLPESVLNLIDEAPRYPEGRAVRMEVKSKEGVRIADKLTAIKLSS